MHIYQASVRARVNGHSPVIKIEDRVMNADEVPWLLGAPNGFHSIQSGADLINIQKPADSLLRSK
jgi:hypothetical protein